jgi:hypothetical protein
MAWGRITPGTGIITWRCACSIKMRVLIVYEACLTITYTSGLVVRVSGYRSRGPGSIPLRYQLFWEVVGLERGPLSPVCTNEELLGRKISGSGLEIREYGRRDPSCWPRDTIYPQLLTLTSLISGGRSVSIIRLRTEAKEFFSNALLPTNVLREIVQPGGKSARYRMFHDFRS